MSCRKPTIDAPIWSMPDIHAMNQTFALKVVTPLFGGGYEARKIDLACPIRPASVRGHLRFWWRATAGAQFATAGAQFATSEALFQAEEALWGSDKRPGTISLHVVLQEKGEPQTYSQTLANVPNVHTGAVRYALFPFQGDNQQAEASCLHNVAFTLNVSGPSSTRAEVTKAIYAWVRYGGIGARTRRGCGSLCLTNSDTIPPLGLQPNVTVEALDDLTVLQNAVYLLGPEQHGQYAALLAWAMAVQVYNDFRQKVSFARNPPAGTSKSPGRSKWPEPDAIRRITGDHYDDGAKNHAASHLVHQGFPRADLGLPIIFHFKDYKQRPPYGVQPDPADATLEGPCIGRLRFASPIITKAFQSGAGRFRPLIVILNAPHVWHYGPLILKHGGGTATIAGHQVNLNSSDRSNVAPMGGTGIRQALAAYARGLGWK